MNDAEWADFEIGLDNSFKGDLTEFKAATYRDHLGHLDVGTARAALRLLVAQGQAWLPAPGEIMAAVNTLERPSAPPFAEAWPVIARSLDRLWLHYGSPEEKARRKLQLVSEIEAQLGEGPARWVERTAERLVMEPTNDPDVSGVVLHRLGLGYAEACQQAVEDRQVGRAVERAKARGLARDARHCGRWVLARARSSASYRPPMWREPVRAGEGQAAALGSGQPLALPGRVSLLRRPEVEAQAGLLALPQLRHVGVPVLRRAIRRR